MQRGAQIVPEFAKSFTRGSENQHESRVGGAQAGQKLIRQIGGIAVGLHGHRPGDVLLRDRAGIHQQASNSLIEFASSTACVRRRALILDMIAVMWVFTVASAIDSS